MTKRLKQKDTKKKAAGTTSKATNAKGKSKPTAKKSAKSAQVDNSEEAPEEDQDDGDPSSISIAWTKNDHAMTFTMLNAIEDNPDISDALFPGKGANRSTTKGGGKKKTEFHQMLCDHTFKDHPEYGAAYALAKTKAQKTAWCLKVKNQLKRVCDITRGLLGEMEETGAGIVRHDEVDESLQNEFVRTWKEVVKPRAPWFFEVRALIDKRPNLVPTGLGNSQTAIDADIILNPNGGADAEIQDRAGRDGEETSEVEVEDNDDGNEDAEGGSDEDEDDEDDDDELPAKVSSTVPAKRTAPEPDSTTPTRKRGPATAPKKPTPDATPAPPTKPKPKKPKVADFSDVVIAEEATQKTAHELSKAKVERDRAKHQNKTDMARDHWAYKRDRQRTKALRAEAELERMRIRRMRLEAEARSSQIGAASSSRSHARTPVRYPSDDGNNDMFGAMNFVADNNFAGFNGDLGQYGGGQNNFGRVNGGEEAEGYEF